MLYRTATENLARRLHMDRHPSRTPYTRSSVFHDSMTVFYQTNPIMPNMRAPKVALDPFSVFLPLAPQPVGLSCASGCVCGEPGSLCSVSRSHLSSTFHDCHARETQDDAIKPNSFSQRVMIDPSLPVCPRCRLSLISFTQTKRND